MLISVGKLDEEGYHIGFRDQQWKVTKGSLVVARRNKHGSLYMVKVHPEGIGTIINGSGSAAVQGNYRGWSKFIQKAMTLHLLHQSKDLATMILLSKTTAGVAIGLRIPERSATYSSSLTKPIQKIQVILVDILENLVKNDSIVAEHGLSSKITQSPGRSSDTSKGSENSGSFEDMVRSDCKEYSEDGSILQGREALRLLTQGTKITESLCSVKEPSYVGALNDTSTQHKNEGFQLASWAGRKPRVQFEEKYIRIKASTKTMCSDYEAIDALRSSVLGYVAYSDYSCNEEPCSDVHQVGDEREVKVLDSFNWPSSELITEDGVLPERGGAYHVVQIQWDKWSVTLEQVVCGCRSVRTGQELYTVQRSVQRIESARATLKAHLPYGMFLTRLFRHVMEHYPYLDNGIYNAVDRVMHPLALKQTWKPRSDRGKARHSVSSTSAHHNCGSSSHQGDDDEDDGASCISTPSPTTYLNSLKPLDYQQYDIPTFFLLTK
ncbi:hypothetical protein Tco_0255672 [Tanacetum coccineum]